jgi:ribosomal protein S18 acetylase RimI-like enzyme
MSDSDPCIFLDWDTAFFNLRIARVYGDSLTSGDMPRVDAWCAENAIDCLYFLARSDEPSVLRVTQMHGFDLVDIRITYSLELSNLSSIPYRHSEVLVRPSESVDLLVLKRIARYSYTDSRFYADEHFPRQLCDSLYETWIDRSCAGYADIVFVAESNQTPVGYITCHLDTVNKQGSIGLVGVANQAQNQGVGQALIRQALAWFEAQKMLKGTIVTQGRNITAQRLYQKNGFLTKSVQLWYHKWYKAKK